MYANPKYIGTLINNWFSWQNFSENGIEFVFTPLRGWELKLILWMLFWLQWWSTKGYFCGNTSEICKTQFIIGYHWDYSGYTLWCGTPRSSEFWRHTMQEHFPAQLIVPSGYLERSETGFGGGFITFFWHYVCFVVLGFFFNSLFLY